MVMILIWTEWRV